jgi:hypothetical protein
MRGLKCTECNWVNEANVTRCRNRNADLTAQAPRVTWFDRRKQQELALPIPATPDRYGCPSCSHQFVGAPHGVELPPE